MGGSLPAPVKTANEQTENEFADGFKKLETQCNTPALTVIHQPPINTKLDQVGSGDHVGSNAVREFLQRFQPVVCFTGHIHDSSGIDTIGNTTVVNPGPAKEGRYAVIKLENGAAKVELKRLGA